MLPLSRFSLLSLLRRYTSHAQVHIPIFVSVANGLCPLISTLFKLAFFSYLEGELSLGPRKHAAFRPSGFGSDGGAYPPIELGGLNISYVLAPTRIPVLLKPTTPCRP